MELRFSNRCSGVRAEEALGKQDAEVLPFVSEQGLDVLLGRALSGESACTDFAYFVPKSGCAGWGSASFEPLRTRMPRLPAVLATVQEITQLKLARQALGQSEERYRSVVERAADVIYMVSPDCSIISLNQAFETLTGWRRAEWIGKSFLTLLHPNDVSTGAALFQQVLGGESVSPFELRFASRSGEYLVGECTAAPQIGNQRVVSASGIVRDITARKRVEEALRHAEQEYRSIFENALDGMFRSTPEGRFVLVNPALADVGYDSPEDLVNSVAVINHQFYADPERRSAYERLMKDQGFVERFENQARRKTGG
jgi:PAS domain S-box-containing protein